MQTIPFEKHPLPNRDDPVAGAIKRAKELCQARSVRLTELREQVLTLIWRHRKPLGAYALMDLLAESSDRKQVAPPTVYRTIDFLIAQGLIHKIHSLNAYFGCPNPRQDHCDALFICSHCGFTEEVPNNTIQQAINLSASQHKFMVQAQMLEIAGLCVDCKKAVNTK